jgi:hypothetical protein
MISNETKQKAADSITNQGINFSIEFNGCEYLFTINKLVLKTLIRISGEVSKLAKYNLKTSSVEVILSVAGNAKILTRCIAIAVINSKPRKRKPFFNYLFPAKQSETEFMSEDELTNLFTLTFDSEQLRILSNAVVTQMNTADFFAATISIGGIDLLKQTDEMVTGPHSQSGEE